MTTKDKLEKIAASVAKAVEQEPNFNTERIKRQLWADLQRLKRLHKKEHPESDSKDDVCCYSVAKIPDLELSFV